ncbi:AAA family ATPase [Lacibacterium aquatile]|uniref:AAA family ATPase n=1 Tax=Lacibacterium aquatile TaxID=1168082 RepID=A0ABW5DRS0_9PROT
MQVLVDTILSEHAGGVIFSGQQPDGQRLIVKLAERIFPASGDLFEVSGTEGTYTDARGIRHRQIEATTADRLRTSGRLLGPWLQTLPGIGPERAQRLLDRFGPDLLDVLDDPTRLTDIAEALAPGRSATGIKLASLVMARLAKRQTAEANAIAEGEFYRNLEDIGVSDRPAARALYRLIGSKDAWAKLQRHPYALAGVVPWAKADHLAQRLLSTAGVSDPGQHPDRLIGACDAVWRDILDSGDTAAQQDEFEARLAKLRVDPAAALQAGLAAKRVLRRGDLLRPPGAAALERRVATEINRIRRVGSSFAHEPDIHHHLTGLTDEQRTAVVEILCRRFALLQGFAGTGKTTTMRALVAAHEARGGRVILASLAGKAALRLSRSTGRLATTIARLLHGLTKRQQLVGQGRAVPDLLPFIDSQTMVIIDEGSMVDLVAWSKLLPLIPDGASLVIVGDVAQLPPIGLGCVYHDLVAANDDVLYLTQVQRQAAGNDIVTGATQVRQGQPLRPPAYNGIQPGLTLLECDDDEQLVALAQLRQDCTAAQISNDDLLVIAGLRQTCRDINQAMQDQRRQQGAVGTRLGPQAAFVSIGDPVICGRNRYDEALMNGLMGSVASIEPVEILLDGEVEPRALSPEALIEMQSAWGITCHRAQGSEARIVIVLLDGTRILTRRWLYTAITRGIEQVILVGSQQALERCIERDDERTTAFAMELAAA